MKYSFFIICCILLLAGCGEEKKQSKGVIQFSVVPYENEEQLKKVYVPILTYLSEKTGYEFKFNISENYDTLKNDMLEGRIQFGCFAPVAYAKAYSSINDKVTYLATAKSRDDKGERDSYEGYIVVRKNSRITAVEELKGKKIAFVSKTSASGYKYPLAELLKRDIVPDDFFSSIVFGGTHDTVTDALAEGRTDACATWDANYEKAVQKHGDIFSRILTTAAIPFDAWVLSKLAEPGFEKTLQETMLRMNANSKTADGKQVFVEPAYIVGFSKKSDDFYEPLAEMLKRIENYEKSATGI